MSLNKYFKTDNALPGIANWSSLQFDSCFTSINDVPIGLAWTAWTGFIPYNDPTISAPGYGGFQKQIGTNISYDNTTHLFTVAVAGTYQIAVVQNINVANSGGFVSSDGRLALMTSPGLIQIAQDSGRVQSSAGMFAAGILSYNLQLLVVADLLPGEYGIFATAEPDGLLLGKGSVVWTQLA